jgi:phage terminase large subunit GpA-like protein
MKPSEWMESNFNLTKKDSAEPGPFRFKRTPHLEEIVDCLGVDHPAKKVTWKKSTQVAASTGGNGLIGYWAEYAPAPILFTMPSEKVLKRASRNRIQPMIDASPVLSKIFSEKKSRDSANSATEKDFDGGVLYLASAASSNDLASVTVKYAVSDEYSKFPQSVSGEGSVDALVDARLQTFGGRSKHFKVSTPTIDGECLVSKDYELTDKRKRFVLCPSCRSEITLEFENLKWNKDKDGNHLAETVYYECPACEFHIDELKHKTKMLSKEGGAKWIATEKNPKEKNHVGFHINALYSPLGWKSWESIASDWIKGHKKKEDRIAFTNTVLGLAFKETNKNVPKVDLLMQRRESYPTGVIPEQANNFALLGGVDVQGDRIEITVRACGMRLDGTLESYIIDHRIFYGDVEISDPLKDFYFDPETGKKVPSPWGQLYNYLTTPLPTFDGKSKFIIGTAIDSGFKAHKTYLFARRFVTGFLFVIKGRDELPSRQLVSAPSMVDVDINNKKIKNGARLYSISANIAKSMVYESVNIPAPTAEQLEVMEGYPGDYTHFPMLNKDYFEQLTSEALVQGVDKKTGKRKKYWKKLRDRNETLDCFGYTFVAWKILKLDSALPENFDAIVDALEENAIELFSETP